MMKASGVKDDARSDGSGSGLRLLLPLCGSIFICELLVLLLLGRLPQLSHWAEALLDSILLLVLLFPVLYFHVVRPMALQIKERKQAEERHRKMLAWQQGINLLQQSLLSPARLEDKLKTITDSIVSLFDADFCRIWLIRPGDRCERGCVHADSEQGPHACRYRDRCLHLLASSGRYTHIDGKAHRRVPFGAYKIGRVASSEDHKFLTNDVTNDPRVHDHGWARDLGLVSFAGYQIRIPGGETLGVLALFARHAIGPAEDALLDGLSSTLGQIIQQAEAQDAIRESERQIRLLLDSIAEGYYAVDTQGNCTVINGAGLRMLGYDKEEELLGRHVHELIHHSRSDGSPCPPEECRMYAALGSSAECHADDEVFWRRDGTSFPVEYWSSPILRDGELFGAVASFLDITRRKQEEESRAHLENQLRQAQKMEAIGLLAAGVAHDFNNMLTAIINFAAAARDELGASPKARQYLDEVLGASERATRLTHQLLAFGRKQVLQPRVINMTRIVEEMGKMIQRLIGENIHYTFKAEKDIWSVMADPGQIEQILLNLAVNAKDAMPEGGRLNISIENVMADEVYCQNHAEAVPGRFVAISIADTGTGITPEERERVFEPFFTTKEIGKGTGLGLAAVYGAVKQSGGFIHLYSEVGMGTAFRACIPAVLDEAEPEAPAKQSAPVGVECILVAEDEEPVREAAVMVLESLGYRALAVKCVAEAKALFEGRGPEVDLLLTDMIMPDGTGRDLYDAISALRPGMRTVFMSGYTDDVLLKKGAAIPGTAFIQKPFTRVSLARKLREVLDEKDEG